MPTLAGYENLMPIHHSENSRVYRARRVSDRQSVILKFLNRDYPNPDQIRRYKQEYYLTCQLDAPGIIKAYHLEEWQRSYAIVLEDFGAMSLRQYLQEREGFSLGEFLQIAIGITESLGQIHAQNIIHKDINPTNIVIHPETQQLKIIDFGISTQLSRENPTLKNPNVLEGTLAYISPEQTGRMNRGLDYRTDFYSLGVTFYELLTGKLPFTSTDALELVHCHIAKKPAALGNREQKTVNREEIPKILSDIVLKLMAKNAEDRYQSAWGLKADLEHCLTQLEATGKIEAFPLRTQDIYDRFQIPQKLYGREKEIATLLAAYQRVAKTGTVELMLVAGYSGIGKSALVQELYKPITARRGYFISGKFDQFQRNIPYSAIVSAFQELIKQILTESETELAKWKEKILTAVGKNGQVIVDTIPELELIIGQQPAVAELAPTEAQNRFNFVFQNFFRAFCSQEHYLVIFLDDLQWVDSATLNLIELMMLDSNLQYLLLIGAYRDNEVDPLHPLTIALEELKKTGASINTTTLTPLKLDSLNKLMAEALQSHIERVKPLAELIQQKTGGNPFFVNQFLATLYSDNLIQFNPPQSPTPLSSVSNRSSKQEFWKWDINDIKKHNITDNVVELMIGKLKKLPDSTQAVLRLGACIGASFDLTTLSIILEKSRQAVFPDLITAIQTGLILPLSDLDPELLIQDYRFLHDRVQQAAYALIDEEQKIAAHLKIGRLLLQNTPADKLSEKIFEIIDHLNIGVALIADSQEREEIAQLNLTAGQKAKSATAYTAASDYFHTGIKLLNSDSWKSQYDLTLNLYTEAVEAAYLNGNFEQMETSASIVQKNAKTVLDRVNVYNSKIQAAVSQGKFKEGIQIGLQVLEQLGVSLPENPSDLDIQSAYEKTAPLYAEGEIEELIHLPKMTNPEIQAVLYIMLSVSSTAYSVSPQLLVLVVISETYFSLKYGNDIRSIFGYACYGPILCAVFEDIESGYQFGQLALKLLEQFNAKNIESEVFQMLGGHVIFWKKHLKETFPILREGYQVGVETGSFEYAGGCVFFICSYGYFFWTSLPDLEKQTATYINWIRQIRRANYWNYITTIWQAILNLLGQSENPCKLVGEAYNEDEAFPDAIAVNDRTHLHLFYLHKAILCYLFGEREQSLENSLMAEEYLDGVISQFVVPVFYFYDSLIRLNLFTDASPFQTAQPESWLDRINSNQEQIQHWAQHAPMNFLHKFHLVEAEKCRVLGKKGEAIEFYHQAIAGAKENEYIQEEALAYELLAKFYLDWGQEKVAQVYMTEAHHCYSLWGAVAKVKHLEENYPQLYPSEPKKTTVQVGTKVTSDSTENTTLDLATVIKATNAIASEIVLDKLLATLMKIIIENAGADRGILLLPRGESLWVEAIKEANSENIAVLASIPLAEFAQISVKTVNYVARTLETVVLNDALNENAFADDAYIQEHHCQSIACTPFVTQGKLQGIVYLENNLTPEAFTEERMALLRTIATQAAISLENARLYETLEQRVRERTAELSQTVEVLKKTQAELKLENDLLKTDEQAASFDYQIGGSLDFNSPTYVVRSADRHLYQAIRLGEFCYTFNARQMGKSSLMVRILKKLNEEEYRCIAIDLTLIGGENVTPDQWYKGLAVELWRRFGLLGKVNLKSWWAERLDISAPQRLMQFIEDVLLVEVKNSHTQEPANLAIFLDEIDCILSLHFPVNDFFALIRSCYNQRAIDSKYKRLTFGFFGVATPSMLISDPLKTPFNLGRPIQLAGFKVNEAQPLLYGLGEKVHNPQTLLKEVMSWTGGQPFLTQKLCHLIRHEPSEIPTNGESQWLAELVQEKIIQHWETQDEPEHLRTIRDRLLRSYNKIALLRLYEDILTDEEVSATDSETEQELLLSGLVVSTAGRLQLNNRIYQAIFDRHWLEQQSD